MVFKCPSRLNHVKDPDVLIINRLADDNRSNEAYAVAGKGTANESYLLRVLYIFPDSEAGLREKAVHKHAKMYGLVDRIALKHSRLH